MKYNAVIAIPGRSPIQVITTPNAAYPYFHAIDIHVYTTLHSGKRTSLSPSNKAKLGPYSKVTQRSRLKQKVACTPTCLELSIEGMIKLQTLTVFF